MEEALKEEKMNEKELRKEKKRFTILGISIWELLAYFIIYSVAGYIIETLFALVRYGVLESRQSFLYGPFCSIYGVGAIREQKQVQLVVKLETWNADKVYDRLGTEEFTQEILGVQIPLIEIPVKPGRNLPIIIETAAMNERLKSMGYYSAREFNQNVLKWIETGAAQSVYYGSDDAY